MSSGSIVETGNHDQLMSSKIGAYAKLIKAQQMIGAENISASTLATSSESNEACDDIGVTASQSNSESIPESKTSFEGNDTDKTLPEEPQISKSYSPLWRTLSFCKPNILLLAIALFTSFFNGTILPIFASSASALFSVFNVPASSSNQSIVNFWTLVFVAMALADFVVPIIRRYLYFVVEGQMSRVLRAASFKAILSQEIAFFDRPENGTGALAAKLASEVDRIAPCVGGNRMGLLVQALGGFGLGMVLGFIHVWQVTLLALACVPPLTIGVFWELMSLDRIADESKVF
jgi:ATP-binding cassette, subfamily B (MDR/TAP), member 1